MSVLSSVAPSKSDHDETPEGEVEAEFSLFLVSESGTVVALTETDVRIAVDLEGIEEPEVANQVVASGMYTSMRIVFTEIEAEVDAGLIINGVPVVGQIRVELEDISLTVTKPLALDIGRDQRVELLVDLNAASWLQAVDPLLGTVDAQIFADLVSVIIR